MKYKYLRLFTGIFLVQSFILFVYSGVDAQERLLTRFFDREDERFFLEGSISERMNPENDKKILFIADNQEHLLTGTPLRSMSPITEKWVTSVALRSPLANVGSRPLLGEILNFGRREGADLVIHLGDASDISCPNELASVFDLLDKEYRESWFIAPGNHDGLLAGTLASYQPHFNYEVPKIFKSPPNDGHRRDKKTWLNACLTPSSYTSPANRPNILTKGDAIEMYIHRLEQREGVEVRKIVDEHPPKFSVKNKTVIVPCYIKEITIGRVAYQAIARVCERTKISEDSSKWVGPFASFIIQKIGVAKSTLLILDTSSYINPTIKNVGLDGELSDYQKRTALDFIAGMDRDRLIIAGHHPFGDMKTNDQEWIASNAGRYLSAHVHRSAQIIEHQNRSGRVRELNIGSTLDYPPQAVVAIFNEINMKFRVAGADVLKTKWPGFLEPCSENVEKWKLPLDIYNDYSRGTYIVRLLRALTQAAEIYNAQVAGENDRIVIPTGKKVEDWKTLESVLNRIGTSKGREREFWACQGFYASEETKKESSILEQAAKILGRTSKSGMDATGSVWRSLKP